MGFKLIVERLVKEELQYELRIRGIPADDIVKNLRVAVRQAIKKEAQGEELDETVVYPFSFEEDATAIRAGALLIEKLIDAFGLSPAKETAFTIETKLTHYVNRADKSIPVSVDEEVLKTQYTVNLAVLMSRYQLLITKSANGKVNLAISEPAEIEQNVLAPSTSAIKNEPIKNIVVKSTPVAKWGLKFSGEPRSISISAFLERVNELIIARKVDPAQLLDEAIDLFASKALIWFRANKSRVNSWFELVDLLNQEFRPIDYDDRLLDEIKRRTQGSDETMSIYVSVMKTMFARLLESLTEDKQLRIVLRNLTPFYQNQLGLTVVTSFDQLLACGRTIEERRFAIESYVPPTRKKNDLEADLAYLNLNSNSREERNELPATSFAVRTHESNRGGGFVRGRGRGRGRGGATTVHATTVQSCWNCHSTEHFASRCPEPQKQMYCYRCGNPGVTTRTCSTCSNSNDNYRDRFSSENSEGRH